MSTPSFAPTILAPQPSEPIITDGNTIPFEGEKENDTNTSNNTPAFPSHPSAVVFKIKGSGLGRVLHITSPSSLPGNTGGDLYTCNFPATSQPDIIITSSDNREVGSILFQPLSRTSTVTSNGTKFDINHNSVLKSGYSFTSPSLGGKKMQWQGRSTSVPTDDTGKAMARLQMKSFTPWKEESVEILGEGIEAEWGTVMEEVLIRAIAVMESRRRTGKNNAGPAMAGGLLGSVW